MTMIHQSHTLIDLAKDIAEAIVAKDHVRAVGLIELMAAKRITLALALKDAAQADRDAVVLQVAA